MGETRAPLHNSAHSAGAERGSFFSDAARREGISMAAYQQPYIQQHDPEMGYGADDKGLVGGDSYGEFMDKQVRRGFIRKVFGILSVQLLITFAIAASLMSVDGAKLYVQQNAWPVSVAAVSLFGSLISLACCGDLHRKFPYNYALLGIFTVARASSSGSSACSTTHRSSSWRSAPPRSSWRASRRTPSRPSTTSRPLEASSPAASSASSA